MQIETERMIIRKIRKSDALGMFYYARKPNVGPNAGLHIETSMKQS